MLAKLAHPEHVSRQKCRDGTQECVRHRRAEKCLAALLCVVFVLAPRTAAQESPLRQAARLDAEHKCDEAERFYQQALAQGPPSTALLNNLGNHYLLCGEVEKSRAYFERLVKVNPAHANANLQLARMAADRRQGALALGYLAHVTDSQPATRMLRAEALHWAGKNAAALSMLDGVQKEARADPRLEYLYGITCARIGAYDRAVAAFNSVLSSHPDDFEVLFNLGRAAARAQMYDRARHALEVAVKLQPGNVDALMELAGVNVGAQGLRPCGLSSSPGKKAGSGASRDSASAGPRGPGRRILRGRSTGVRRVCPPQA